MVDSKHKKVFITPEKLIRAENSLSRRTVDFAMLSKYLVLKIYLHIYQLKSTFNPEKTYSVFINSY